MSKKKDIIPVCINFDEYRPPKKLKKTIIIHGDIMPIDIIDACEIVKEGWILSSINTEANPNIKHTINYIKYLEE